MIEIVTLSEAKGHLRLDYTDAVADSDLRGKIATATATVLDYIQGNRSLIIDDDGQLIEGSEALVRVKGAILVFTGILNRTRNGEEDDKYRNGYLPFSVEAIIRTLRKPTIL